MPRTRIHSRDRRHAGRDGMVEVTLRVPVEKADALVRHATRLQRAKPADPHGVMETLRHHQADLRERFGVVSLSLFGSVARDEATRRSDIDLLVEFAPNRPRGLFEFVALKHMLEGLLGKPVDLVTPARIKPRLKGRILSEAQRVF